MKITANPKKKERVIKASELLENWNVLLKDLREGKQYGLPNLTYWITAILEKITELEKLLTGHRSAKKRVEER